MPPKFRPDSSSGRALCQNRRGQGPVQAWIFQNFPYFQFSTNNCEDLTLKMRYLSYYRKTHTLARNFVVWGMISIYFVIVSYFIVSSVNWNGMNNNNIVLFFSILFYLVVFFLYGLFKKLHLSPKMHSKFLNIILFMLTYSVGTLMF